MNRHNNEYDQFESDLRHILQDHEVTFNPDDWDLMEEKLRRKRGGALPVLQQHKWLILLGLMLLLTTWQLKYQLNLPDTVLAPQASPSNTVGNGEADKIPNKMDNATLDTESTGATAPAKNNAADSNNLQDDADKEVRKSSMPTAGNGLLSPKKDTPPAKLANHLTMAREIGNVSQQLSTDKTKSESKSIVVTNTKIGSKETTLEGVVASHDTQKANKAVATSNLLRNLPINSGNLSNNSNPATGNPATNNLATDAKANVSSAQEKATPLSEEVKEAVAMQESAADEQKETPKSDLVKRYPVVKKPKKKFTAFYAMPTASIDGNFLNGHPLRLGFTTGIALDYQFHRYFSIETGAAFSQKNFQMTTVFDQYRPVFPEQYRAESASMSFVEIPLILKFHVPSYSDECLPYIGIGNSILVAVEKKYTFSLIDPAPMLIEGMDSMFYDPSPPDALDSSPETIWKNVHVKAGASFKLSKRLRFNVESQFKASLDGLQLGENNPIIEKSGVKYNIYSFGLQAGLNYRF